MIEADEHLAAYQRKLERARELLARQAQQRRAEKRAKTDAQVCRCGHRYDEHTSSYSINYIAGFCLVAECGCRHFLSG